MEALRNLAEAALREAGTAVDVDWVSIATLAVSERARKEAERSKSVADVASKTAAPSARPTEQEFSAAGAPALAVQSGWPNAQSNTLIDVKKALGRGRGCFARRDISRGSLLLRLRPAVSVLRDEHAGERCSLCYAELADGGSGQGGALESTERSSERKMESGADEVASMVASAATTAAVERAGRSAADQAAPWRCGSCSYFVLCQRCDAPRLRQWHASTECAWLHSAAPINGRHITEYGNAMPTEYLVSSYRASHLPLCFCFFVSCLLTQTNYAFFLSSTSVSFFGTLR